MKIGELLQRDPAKNPLVNQGQARIADKNNEKVRDELRGELATFVCEGQYVDGIERILSSYLAGTAQTSQKAAWVSGFFGSGKSHLLKMLSHLWADTTFPDGATARGLVPAMPDDLRSLLRELDTAGKRAGGLLAAAGSLPSGTMDHVRLTILSVLLRGAGLPDQYPQAMFCLWLHEQGWFARVRADVEAAGKVWSSELNNLYVSALVARALIACDARFAASEAEARNTLKSQFPARTTDITTDEFLTAARRTLRLAGRDDRLPCTLLVLDEVQQYIGDSNDRSTLVTEVTEAISKQLDGRVIVVAAGQSALTEMPRLHKLMDRFTIRVALSDAEVETVTRKVLLQKKPTAIPLVRSLLATHAGEISRQLQGTRIGEAVHDRETAIDDYPLLPVRRRFWEYCFRQVDVAGTQSQLRSQLRIIHDAVARVSDREMGAVVAADELFDALAPELVNTGVLLRETNETIIKLSLDGSDAGVLRRRIASLVFLIGRLSRGAGADIGVRASKEHIADLLVDDLTADNGKLRSDVEAAIALLVADGILMQLGDEVRLQTREGAEWDRDFRTRQARLANDEADLQLRRDQILYAEIDQAVRSVKIAQGAAKVPRAFLVSREQAPPVPSGESIPIWIRDGWSTSEREVVEAARAAGTESPALFVFINKLVADELRKALIEADAAQRTLESRGAATTPEGMDARRSMESRRDIAAKQRDELIQQIVANAKVFQGGGNELLQSALADRLREAANAALARQFPRFQEGDSPAWEAVIKRAKDGADQPFEPAGHGGATEQHPVCQQVLVTIGAGKLGVDVRKALSASPFGWPRDAVDAALIALHRSQHISATANGARLAAGQLDHARISKAEFRVEHVTLSVTDRLALRRLFQVANVQCKTGEELEKAPVFLRELLALARASGGEAPLPPVPPTADIEALSGRVGNDLLAGIRDRAAALEECAGVWAKAKTLAEGRKPIWQGVERLAAHAAGLPAAAEARAQVAAVRDQRLLLAATDPVSPLRSALADALRTAIAAAHAAHEAAYQAGAADLEQSAPWKCIAAEARTQIVAEVGLAEPTASDVSTDSALLAALDSTSLAARATEADAVSGRVRRAIEHAAKLLQPKIRAIALERATLGSAAEVSEWIARQEKSLLAAIQDGPVLVG